MLGEDGNTPQMFILQVLDGAESREVRFDGSRLVFGSAPAANVPLLSPGIAPSHFAIEAIDGVAVLQALDGKALVNGKPKERVVLALGDRIEAGSAVLVVASVVSRPAGPDDVLDGARARRSSRARVESPAKSGSKAVLLGVGAAVVLGAVAFFVLGGEGGGGVSLPPAFAELDRLRRAGSFELAREQAAQLGTWATDDARRAALEQAVQRVVDLEQRVQRRRDAILAQASERTYAEFSDELKRDERSAKEEDERIASRIVRSGLSELLRGAVAKAPPSDGPETKRAADAPSGTQSPKPPVSDVPSPAIPVTLEEAKPKTQDAPAVAQTVPQQPAEQVPSPRESATTDAQVSVDDVAAVIESARGFLARSEFAQASVQLEMAIGGAAASDRDRLQGELETVRTAAKSQLEQVLARARNEAQNGRVQQGIDALVEAQSRFPASGPFAAIPTLLEEFRRAQAGGPIADSATGGAATGGEAARRRTLELLAPALIRIRALENDGEFANAAAELKSAADSVRATDPDYATRLDMRIADLARVAAWHTEITAVAAVAPIEAVVVDRGTVRIVGASGGMLRVAVAAGEENVSWHAIEPDSIAQIASAAKVSAQATLGAASLLYRRDARRLAERALARALQVDASLKQEVWRTVAHGRGEAEDPRGYELRADGFVSVADADAEKQAGKVIARIDAALRSKDKKARESLLTDALALGPAAVGAIASRLQRLLDKEIETLDASPTKKLIDKLSAQRQALDVARQHAKDLIYDEVKYFYPYNPPQVASDRYAEYVRVQQEVNQRVDAVRALWNDARTAGKVPANFAEAVDRLDWIAITLRDLGELDPLAMVGAEWARAVVPGQPLGIQTFCKTAEEKEQLQLWVRIEAYNETLGAQIERGDASLLRITNAYRAMFRHRPLALDLKVLAAAKGHAKEMSQLGYFSHFSPTPGRKTPTDRMLLAGYTHGASENIALTDGAESAHLAWCQSSGHHRNLLNANFTEAGMGGDGRNWVQNFGSGSGYEAKLDTGVKAR